MAASVTEFQIEEIDDVEQRLVLIGQHLASLDELTVQANAGASTVDLTDNRLESGALLDRLSAMRTLILDKNFLDEFPADFPVLPSVETLWINNNAVRFEIDDGRSVFKDSL